MGQVFRIPCPILANGGGTWHAILHWYLLRIFRFSNTFFGCFVLADFLIGQMIYLTLTSFMLFG